jgi:Fe-S-cluster containining protein
MRPRELLPILLSLTDAVVAMSESWAADNGKTISCRAGCAACCRQLVPVSELEALHLAHLVEAMPLDRRERVMQRFHRAREQAAPALRRFHAASGAAAAEEIGNAADPYFALGIPCPFLEQERCSIHPDRPTACREYLVTSPPEHCVGLDLAEVKRVPVPSTVSSALFCFSPGSKTADPKVMPLIESLSWATAHKNDPEPLIPARELFRDFIRQISGGEAGHAAST